MLRRLCFASIALFAAVVSACSSAPEEEVQSTAASELVCGRSIGGGQCLVAVQMFYYGFGVTVGVAPSEGLYDAQGRWCASQGACQIWVRNIPASYGWVRTSNPRPFDIAVYPPVAGNPWGHITVVHHVDASGVWMIDANDDFRESPNNTPHLHSMTPYGYYHYTGAAALGCGGGGGGDGAGANGASCAGYGDGLYCGHNYVNGDRNTLYRCAGGVAYVKEKCANGCKAAPDGTDDYCAAGSSTTTTASCAGYGDGLYCGHNYVNGDKSTLYRCAGGVAYVKEKCANGCKAAPDGIDDYCAPAGPSAPAPAKTANCAGYNDALYCGHNYVNGDPNTLYRCTRGVASVEKVCANGCQAVRDGLNDYCK